MGIQINEKNLSSLAVSVLEGSKNKSKFLRDSIEYYVRKDSHEVVNNTSPSINSKEFEQLKNDVSEIKTLLLQLVNSGVSIISSQIEENKIDELMNKVTEAILVEDQSVPVKHTQMDINVGRKILKQNNLSEEEKMKIEQQVSLNLF